MLDDCIQGEITNRSSTAIVIRSLYDTHVRVQLGSAIQQIKAKLEPQDTQSTKSAGDPRLYRVYSMC